MLNLKIGFRFLVAFAMLVMSTFAGAITIRVSSLSTDTAATRTTEVENVLINFLQAYDHRIKRPEPRLAGFSVQYSDDLVEDATWIGGSALSPKVELKGNFRAATPVFVAQGPWGPGHHQNRKILTSVVKPMSVPVDKDPNYGYDPDQGNQDFWDGFYNADLYYENTQPTLASDARCLAACEAGFASFSRYCSALPVPQARAICYAAAATALAACSAGC